MGMLERLEYNQLVEKLRDEILKILRKNPEITDPYWKKILRKERIDKIKNKRS